MVVAWRGLTTVVAVVTVSLAPLHAIRAQPLPSSQDSDSGGSGSSTTIPVTSPGETEVLGAEGAATSSGPAPIAIETPIDPDAYICGPGDEFELSFWGRQNFRLRIAADLEGRTFISKIGYVTVAGKSLTAVRKLIRGKVRANYPGLRFDLTLARPRRFLVHVVNNVKKAGMYAAHPLERVSSVVERAGITGSRRRISIRRTNGTELQADLLLYELTGDTRHNPYVLDGDRITVPFAEVVVKISGPVRRPGSYELTKTRDLAELLELAGGFKSSVAKTLPIQVIRRNKNQRATYHDLPFTRAGEPPNHRLRDDDDVVVRSVAELQQSILLIGAVTGADPLDPATNSKRLSYVRGDTVRSLIERAGGVKAPGDLKRSYISRPREDKQPELIPVDLEALLVYRDYTADKPVKMGDTIVIPRMRRSILVEGAVARAGLYDYNPRFGILAYVAHAGGLSRTARDVDEIKIVRPNGATFPFGSTTKPEPGDTILVPERHFSRAEIVQIVIAGAGLVLSGAALYISATR
jgi:protein involved in polysaccharide export with SLBB domain